MGYRVGIIGKFGANENWCDGQTVKTKNLMMLLERAGDVSIVKADTCYFKRNNLKLLLDTLRCMFTCKHIFLMVSVNGMRFYLPFLYYMNKVMRRSIYHYVIGSELLDMVSKDRKLVKYLNALDANWFEYESGTCYLKSKGVKNVSTLSNFKLLDPVPEAKPYFSADNAYRFCTFSRVMEEKGITDAIEAIRQINEEHDRAVARLDIYGQIEKQYEDKFRQLINENREYVAYKGVAESSRSVDVLKDYYALLFPTKWVGEGVPGTLIDSFAAGIPVIASDWNANGEIIQHNRQGLLYPNDGMLTLKDAVDWAIHHPEAMHQMRFVSREAYVKYMPDTILKVIHDEMRKKEL